jgi:hypothetical protein
MYRELYTVLFALASGLTASGIVANLYRLAGQKPESLSGRIGYIAVMVLAGPSVLFDNAARARRKKDCSAIAFWMAAAIAGYWSFVIGLFVLNIALAV